MIIVYLLCFHPATGTELVRRGQRVRVHVQFANGAAAVDSRVQVQDQRTTQVGVALAEKQTVELRSGQRCHRKN